MKDASCSPFKSLSRMFHPIICFRKVLFDLIREENEAFKANTDHKDLNNSNQKSTLQPMFHQTETGS